MSAHQGKAQVLGKSGAVEVIDIDLSSIPFFGHDPFKGGSRGNRRMTGWL